MPSGRNVEAKGTDWSKPVRTVPVTAKGKCTACRDVSQVKLNVKANIGTIVTGSVIGNCANKKCDTKPPLTFTFKIKIT